jgi:hypothetical protein
MGRRMMIGQINKTDRKAIREKGGNEIKVQNGNGQNEIKLQKREEGKESGMIIGWKRRRDGMPIQVKGRR